MLAVCHTAMVEETKDGELRYSASSPDELALVLGARDVGIVYTKRSSSQLTI